MRKIGLTLLLFLLYGSTWAQTTQTAGQKAVQAKQATVIDTDSLLQLLEKDSVITSTSVSEDSVVNTEEGIQTRTQSDKLAASKDSVVSGTDTLSIKAQKIKPAVRVLPNPYMLRFTAFLKDFRKDYDDALERWEDPYLLITGIKPDPDFFKLAFPATYYEAPVQQAFGIDGWEPASIYCHKEQEEKRMQNLAKLPDLRKSEKIDRQVNRQLLNFYVNYPTLVVQNEANLKQLSGAPDKLEVKDPPTENILNAAQGNLFMGQMPSQDLYVLKPNFWTQTGNGYLQFSQNYISKNWYKGGNSAKSLVSGFTRQANYDDKQRIQFENKFEWKLGFITSPGDTLHSYTPNNDLLRLKTKFGYKAITHWYYTLSVDFETQLFSTYETNTNNLVSAFFSPAKLNVGLGMDYKYTKGGCNLSVMVNPLNYSLYAVASDRVDPTRFNIKEGHKTENEFGSRLEANISWKIIPMLLWESRFTYTTDYKKVVSEWENTFTFAFNKYLSTKLFVHGRFDDGVAREPDRSYFQLQELLSFGLNYTW